MPVYFDKDTRRWRYTFNRKVDGRRHRASRRLPAGWSRAQAEAYDREQSSRLYAEAAGIQKRRLTLAGAVQLYLDKKVPRQRAAHKARQHLAQLLPYIEGAALDDVGKVGERYTAAHEAELAPATIRQRLAYLKAAVRFAKRKYKYGDQDYGGDITLPTVNNERQVYLRVPAVRKLLALIEPAESRAVFALAFWTGSRWISEILPRTKAHLERRGRELWLNVGETKNGTPRMVPVHPEARWALEHLPFERNWRDYYKDFERARKAAGLPHVVAHDLRHSLASDIVWRGGTLVDVQGALHHESMQSSRRYAHLYPERLREVMLGTGSRKNAPVRRQRARKAA